ncbi:unnamed protein product [Coccothraustes coccothraustes]
MLAAVLLLLPPGAAPRVCPSPRSDSLPGPIPVPSAQFGITPAARPDQGPAGPGGTKEPERAVASSGKGRGEERARVMVAAPEICRAGMSFAPKPRLSRSRGQLPALEADPDPTAATSPGHPAGTGSGRSCPALLSLDFAQKR